MSANRAAAAYFGVQAAAIAGWWAVLLLAPSSRAWFTPAEFGAGPLLAFWPADLFAAAASGMAWLRGRRSKSAGLWPALAAGAIIYAACYCVGAWLMTGGAPLAAALMAPAALLSLMAACKLQNP